MHRLTITWLRPFKHYWAFYLFQFGYSRTQGVKEFHITILNCLIELEWWKD